MDPATRQLTFGTDGVCPGNGAQPPPSIRGLPPRCRMLIAKHLGMHATPKANRTRRP
jgi:hypothetical protein